VERIRDTATEVAVPASTTHAGFQESSRVIPNPCHAPERLRAVKLANPPLPGDNLVYQLNHNACF
jgi:hypothetical protein